MLTVSREVNSLTDSWRRLLSSTRQKPKHHNVTSHCSIRKFPCRTNAHGHIYTQTYIYTHLLNYTRTHTTYCCMYPACSPTILPPSSPRFGAVFQRLYLFLCTFYPASHPPPLQTWFGTPATKSRTCPCPRAVSDSLLRGVAHRPWLTLQWPCAPPWPCPGQQRTART